VRAAQSGAAPAFFARQATGLVREASWTDMVIFNTVENTTIGVGFAFGASYILTALVGANLIVAQVLATIFGLFVCTTWGLLSAAMPRSGGDYVINSRVLSGAWGFVASFALFIAQLVFAGTVAAWITELMLSPAFSALGMVLKSSALVNIGTQLSTSGWTVIVGTLLLLGTGYVAMRGIRFSMRVQAITVAIGVLAFALTLIVLIFTSQSSFIHNFNAVAQPYTHVSDTYQYFITQASKGGFQLSFAKTVPYTLVAFLAIQGFVANSFWSAYVAGEAKGARGTRRQLSNMLAPVLITGILLTIAFALFFARTGYNFEAAANYLSASLPGKYAIPAPPFSTLLVAISTQNPVLTGIIGFGLCGWGIAMALATYLFVSRIVFAWGFDRVVPIKIAQVNERFHSPVIALVIIGAGAEAFLLIYTYLHTQIASFVASYFLLPALALALVGLSGVLFPYLKRDLYEHSPAKLEIWGIPVIVVAGGVTFIGEVATGCMYFFYPTLGLPSVPFTAAVLLIPMAVGVLIFYVSKAVRRRQGIDLGAVYQEIPPE
jgi:amino acid transporter